MPTAEVSPRGSGGLAQRVLPLVLLLALLRAPLAAEPAPVLTGLTVETILNSGPSSQKYDLVFCGDGYRKADRKKLKSAVTTMLGEIWATSPFKELKSEFNVHLVYLDAPAAGYGPDGRRVGAYLLGSSRPENARGMVRLQHPERVWKVVGNAPGCDLPVVVTTLPGRSHAGRIVLIAGEKGSVLAHELGHAVGKLGDEYTSASMLEDRESAPLPTGGDLPYPNLTLTRYIDPATPATIKKTAKWGHFLDLPDSHVVSAFQGGFYRMVDVWRPSNTCIMKSNFSGYCPVCHETLYRAILEKTGKTFDHNRYHREFPLSGWAVRGVRSR